MTLETVLLAFALLPVWKEDRLPELRAAKESQAREVVTAVMRESRGDVSLAMFTLAWGDHESHYSVRIGRSDCRPRECDPRRMPARECSTGLVCYEPRARGFWQLHRNGLPGDRWAGLKGEHTTDAQAAEAVKRARSALATCRSSPEPIIGAFRALTGRGCNYPLKGERERLATYQMLMRRVIQ